MQALHHYDDGPSFFQKSDRKPPLQSQMVDSPTRFSAAAEVTLFVTKTANAASTIVESMRIGVV
jgi:hypothetical protein